MLMPIVQERMHPLPMTPPDPDESPILQLQAVPPSIDTAVHVISTECAALANLERIYLTDKLARENLERAVTQVTRSVSAGGKLVISGVGKSGKIGQKIVATMNSLGIQSTFLHPTEAMHGDLGIIKPVWKPCLFCDLLQRSSKVEMISNRSHSARMIQFF
jgi:hypothetical protein